MDLFCYFICFSLRVLQKSLGFVITRVNVTKSMQQYIFNAEIEGFNLILLTFYNFNTLL